MKNLFLIISGFLLIFNSYGQDVNDVQTKPNEFGVHAGFSTGIGLSYRHWFKKPGFQLTLLPVKTEKQTFISAGASLLYTLKETKHIRAYLYLGNHLLMYDRKSEFHFNDEERKDTEYNMGFGPGFSFGSVVAFNIMFGYGFYDITDKLYMYPTIEIGLYYKF